MADLRRNPNVAGGLWQTGIGASSKQISQTRGAGDAGAPMPQPNPGQQPLVFPNQPVAVLQVGMVPIPSAGGRLGGASAGVVSMGLRPGMSTLVVPNLADKASGGAMQPTDTTAITGVAPAWWPQVFGGLDGADGGQPEASFAGVWARFVSAGRTSDASGTVRIRPHAVLGPIQASKEEVLDAIYQKRIVLTFAFFANKSEGGAQDVRDCIASWVDVIRTVADALAKDEPIPETIREQFGKFVEQVSTILRMKASGQRIAGTHCAGLAAKMLKECSMGTRYLEELSWSLAFGFNCETPSEAEEEAERLKHVKDYLK